MEWQPIETAPRDGTQILGYAIDDAPDTQPHLIIWLDGEWCLSWDYMAWKYEPFTHWMPLPEPPQ